ncbi:amidase [Mycena albidolilacea]|uniref:amidase n=1 Tax=Mycena albidolilacea TaxID=1033008 RepID=A0AAD7A0P0_9AGAR|nr:amidase [Mycena albidolilacea]
MAAAKRAFRIQQLEKEAKLSANIAIPDRAAILRSTAGEIVSNIERGTWTASQVLEAFIAQSLVAHTATNCITEVLFEDARARAKQLDAEFKVAGRLKGPLHGVPISVKDQYDIEGYDTTIGFTACAHKPAQTTADFVRAMVDAGAVPFVKTNVPQTMYSYECNNPIWGRTTNPYDAAYTSGGSSGGEACMLALDASVIGLGSDIAGSLRIPASYCGVYSLKPGVGRVSDYGAKESFPGFDGIKSVCGPMARCIDDLELACRVSFGASGAYNDHPPLPFRDVTLPKKLRFGYYTSDGIMKGSPACIRAVNETIEALKLAGHECIEVEQSLSVEIAKIFLAITSADGYKTLLRGVGSDPLDPSLGVLTFGPKVPQLFRNAAAGAVHTWMGDPIMADVLRLSGSKTVEAYHAACLQRNEIKKLFYDEFWNKHNLDGIITYVHASPQILHGGSNMLSMMSTSTLTYNLVDLPCGVVPVTHVKATDVLTDEWRSAPGHGSSMCEGELYDKGFNTDGKAKTKAELKELKPLYDPAAMEGMPIGLQIVGRRWEEEKVLGLMRVVEGALGGLRERRFGPGTWEERLENRKRERTV